MGSPLSPIIADIVLQDLESKALQQLKFVPTFYFRYVDDIILTVPSNQIDNTLTMFNSVHDRIKFTLEIEENKKNKIS